MHVGLLKHVLECPGLEHLLQACCPGIFENQSGIKQFEHASSVMLACFGKIASAELSHSITLDLHVQLIASTTGRPGPSEIVA